ncbi:hypothetical protein HI914_01209 [Erysiphe necator]|nr:hypothetical protein HI914_01209 [Erysiphe necator]
MDIQSKHRCIKQTENLSTQKRLLNMSPGSTKVSPRRVLITTPKSGSSIADRGHTPSSIPRMKSTPSFISSRRSSSKALRNSNKPFKDCGRKISCKISNSNDEGNNSQPIFTKNRTSTNPTRPKSSPIQNHKQIQALTNSNTSICTPRLNPRKLRKPINLDIFRPRSQQKIPIRRCNVKNRDISSTSYCKDRSEFPDWEFIDWPWVTPYAPIDQLTLLSDIKHFNIFLGPRPKIFTPLRPWVPTFPPHTFRSTINVTQKIQDVPVQGPALHDYKNGLDQYSTPTVNQALPNDDSFGTRHNLYLKNPASLRFLLPNDKTASKNAMWDPAVILLGPSHTLQNENHVKTTDHLEGSSSNHACGEHCSKALKQCTKEIINCVSKMRRQDEILLQEVLQAFLDSKNNSSSHNEYRNDSDEKTKTKWRRSSKRSLNPDVPDFHPKTNNTSDGYTEIERSPLLQTTNVNRLPLKEAPSHRQFKESMGILTPQVKPQLLSTKNKSNRNEIKSSLYPYHEKASSDRENDIEEMLMETCLKKIQALESEAQYYSGGANGMLHNYQFSPKNLSFSTGSISDLLNDIEVDDDHVPGRVANAMEQNWAAQMLEKFRSKYPMTGTVKSGPVMDMKKKLFCDQQQRLEYLLLQRKENNIYRKQIYNMVPSEATSWDKCYKA